MGPPVIGAVVKLVSGGIGLASEAIENNKQKKAAKAHAEAQGRGSDLAESSSSAAARPAHYGPPAGDEPPPVYVETSHEHAEQLIASGNAVPVSQSESDAHGYPLDKKHHAGAASHEEDDSEDDDASDIDDEAEWALDDAAEAADPPSYEEVTRQVSDNQLVGEVLRLAGAPPAKHRGIAAPVILPQRRPKQKGRGFVRAYSPVLEDVGISQDCFLTFTKNWHTASQASPWLNVIMLGAFAAGFVPEMAAQIASTVVQVAVGTAQEIQRRHRTNTFLDTMNEQLFMPRGLYAMVLTYKPDSVRPIDSQQLDINETIAKYNSHDSGRFKETMKELRVSSGTTYGQLEIPNAAPLVFPSLDEAAFGGDAKKQSALKDTGKFMADYLDRRAQATYLRQNPNSTLAQEYEQPKFASRFSDPNHAVNSGSWLALVTGGAYDPRERRRAKRDRKNTRRVARGRAPRLPKDQREPKGIIRRAMKSNVLYLVVVNLPSDEEIAAARERLARLQSKYGRQQ